ncbi:hypothetical protein SF123566_2741 [Shigella flexneri 1235-66]|nr:hypothetical protein SF123566_2741 [Shigella flexneri 1235-66]
MPQLQGHMTIFSMNASGDFFHAAICSGLWMPGAPAYPFAWAEICVASLIIKPALARWR